MALYDQNAALFDPAAVPEATGLHFSIVVAEWNSVITGKLLAGATEVLKTKGATFTIWQVPGTFELVSGAKIAASSEKTDGIICLGCVIQGETRHFDFICHAVSNGLSQLNATTLIPHIFGVLTTDNEQQALERCGGKHGHKGTEAAITAIKMAGLLKK